MARAIYTSAVWVANSGVEVAPAAEIEVRTQAGDALATIYTSDEGPDEIVNPSAFADAFGRFFFFADGLAGGYKVILRQGGEEYALEHQAIGNAAELDTGTSPGDVVRLGGNGELPEVSGERLSGVAKRAESERTVADTAYTLVPEDAGAVLLFTSSDAVTLTIEDNQTQDLPARTVVTVVQVGTGAVTVVAGAGVTVAGSPTTAGENAALSLYQREALDHWQVFGGEA